MKRTIPLLLACILLITVMTACGAAPSSSDFTPPRDYDVRYSTTKEYISGSRDGIYKMREFNGDSWFCCVSVPAWDTIVSERVESGDYWDPYYLRLVNTEKYDDFTFQSVSKSQDKMAIVGLTEVWCTPIIEANYTIPYYLGAYNNSIHYRRSIGYLIGGSDEDIEQINGQDPSAYLNRLSKYYNVFRANRGEAFTFSYYDGTDLLSETVNANHYYYIIAEHNEYISLPVTKTTEGFFMVDYSSLTPGYYWFSVGGNETILKIVN